MPKKTENGFTPHITSRKKLCGGFTLIELLVVVAISAVIVVASSIYLGGYRVEQNLKDSASELLAVVKNTQSLSKSEQKGFKWGIHFVNTTSSAGQSYTVFSGVSYASGTVSQTYPLRRNIFFGNPPASSTLDLIFNAVTGYAPYNQIVSLITGRQDGFVNDIIMNTLGQITSKFDTGLVGYWHFDENTSSTAHDASGMGNNEIFAVTTSTPIWQTGSNCKAGSCLSFDGTDNYISAPYNASLNVTSLTICAWVKTSSSGERVVVSKFGSSPYQGYWYGEASDGKQRACLGTGGQTCEESSNTFPTDNTWHFISFTYDNSTGTWSFYLDGSIVGSVVATTSIAPLNIDLRIGVGQWSSTDWFNGSLDEIRVYNRALSATEISDIYNSAR